MCRTLEFRIKTGFFLIFAVGEKEIISDTNELVLDGGFFMPKMESECGFEAPEINSYGHSFRFTITQFLCSFMAYSVR